MRTQEEIEQEIEKVQHAASTAGTPRDDTELCAVLHALRWAAGHRVDEAPHEPFV